MYSFSIVQYLFSGFLLFFAISLPLFIKKRMPHTNIQDRLFRTPLYFLALWHPACHAFNFSEKLFLITKYAHAGKRQ